MEPEQIPATDVVAMEDAQRRSWEAGELPAAECLDSGLWSIPLSIPAGTLPGVLVYAILGDDGVHLLDAGWDSDENEHLLAQGLAAAGRTLDDIATVIVTHHHPDHLGMATRLRARSGALILMSVDEREVLTVAAADDDTRDPDAYRRTLTRWGVPDERHAELVDSVARPVMAGVVEPDALVDDGDVIAVAGRRLEVLSTPGHTGGHICLIDRERHLLFSGDHVLPRIYSGVGIGALPGEEPLGALLRSLERLEEFDDYAVLPGHEYRFTGLRARREKIAAHHLRRTREVAALVETLGDQPIWEYARRLTWTAGWDGLASFWLHSALRQTELHLGFVRSGGAADWLERVPAAE